MDTINEREPEFELDDILREFGSEDLPDMPVDLGEPVRTEPDEPPRDTIRLDKIRRAVRTEPEPSDTVAFTPPAEQEDATAWEPTHEDPPEDYTPPQPILFHPASRLRQLRQKLVEGPERRYYALSEIGTGKLQAAILLHLLLLAVALGGVVLYWLELVGPERLRLLIFSQLLAMLASGLLGCYRMMEGIADLFRGRFTLKTLLLVTFIACCVDGVRCLKSLQVPGCAVFCLQMLMAQLAEKQHRDAEMDMMDTLRRATDLYGVVRIPDYYEGKPGYGTVQGNLEDFMEQYDRSSTPERTMDWFALAALLLSAGIGLYAGLRSGTDQGIRFGTAALLCAAPAGAFFSMTRPLAVLEKRLCKLGTVLCGWQGIRHEKKAACFPLTHGDLFPAGSVKLNGVKYYSSDVQPDTVVAYTASLIAADGSGLTTLFNQLLESRGGYKFHVENFRAYPQGGIGGEVAGDSVLVGTLGFMRQMGVDMPHNVRIPHAVYTAVDGTVCGVFALSFSCTRGTAGAMRSLCGYRTLTPVLVGNDFILTESFLHSKFHARTRRVCFPDRQTRETLAQRRIPEEGTTVVALSVREGLAQKGFAVTGARTLRGSLVAGACTHIAAGLLGLAMIAALAIVGAEQLLTPQNLLLYSLLWLLPGWLITEWPRHL